VSARGAKVVHIGAAEHNDGRGPNRLELLLALEGDIRDQLSVQPLCIHAVNAPRKLIGFDQAFVVRANRRGRFRVEAATSVPQTPRHAPLIKRLTKLLAVEKREATICNLALADLSDDGSYPHRYGLWSPFTDRKKRVFGGLIFARSVPWAEHDKPIVARVTKAYATQMQAAMLRRDVTRWSMPSWLMLALAAAGLAVFFIPVPMSALGDFEVVADKPLLATTPINGVIAQVDVVPGQKVSAGDRLFSLDTTTLNAEAVIAAQKVEVELSKLTTARQGAFSSDDYKRSVLVAEKEYELAKVERDHALALLAKAEVKTDHPGIAIFASVNDLKGKPVQVGERIIEVADPSRIIYRVQLAAADRIDLSTGARVRLFLDADPLLVRHATVRSISFHATPDASGMIAYKIDSAATDDPGEPPAIGLRGTAQLLGEPVSLGYYLFRRPIAALRQRFGI
jgi:hypothetical protein